MRMRVSVARTKDMQLTIQYAGSMQWPPVMEGTQYLATEYIGMRPTEALSLQNRHLA